MEFDRLSRRQFASVATSVATLGWLSGCQISFPRWLLPKVPVIGVVGEAPNSSRWDAFRDGLREVGYVDGETITIEYRWSNGDYDRLPGLVAELVNLNVQCIVTGGVTESAATKQGTSTIPVVTALQNVDAIESGLVQNIARPEGNITGLAGVPGLRLYTKYPELLAELIPKQQRIALLAHARQPNVQLIIDGVRESADQFQFPLEVIMVEHSQEIHSAISNLSADGTRALMIINTSAFNAVRAEIASDSLRQMLPTITSDSEFPQAGGLMAFSVNRNALFHRVGYYVDKILKGSKPSDLPMERPTKFDFIVNQGIARALGIALPPTLLRQATEVLN